MQLYHKTQLLCVLSNPNSFSLGTISGSRMHKEMTSFMYLFVYTENYKKARYLLLLFHELYTLWVPIVTMTSMIIDIMFLRIMVGVHNWILSKTFF